MGPLIMGDLPFKVNFNIPLNGCDQVNEDLNRKYIDARLWSCEAHKRVYSQLCFAFMHGIDPYFDFLIHSTSLTEFSH